MPPTNIRHPEEARSAVSKDGVQRGACGHPSRLAEDGAHLRMTTALVVGLRHTPRGADIGEDGIEAIDHRADLLAVDVKRRHEAQRVRLRRVQ